MAIRTITTAPSQERVNVNQPYTGEVVLTPPEGGYSANIQQIAPENVAPVAQPVVAESPSVIPYANMNPGTTQRIEQSWSQRQQQQPEQRQQTDQRRQEQEQARKQDARESGYKSIPQRMITREQDTQQRNVPVVDLNENLKPLSSSAQDITDFVHDTEALIPAAQKIDSSVSNVQKWSENAGQSMINLAMDANKYRNSKFEDERIASTDDPVIEKAKRESLFKNEREPVDNERKSPPPPIDHTFGRNRKPKRAKDVNRDSIKSRFANKLFRGHAIQGKISGDANLGIMDVSIGSDFISRILAQPNNPLISMIYDKMNQNIDPSDPMYVHDAIRVINESNIMVAVSKSPVNRPSSTQKRRLRVHYGVGIHLHPMAAKTFNADFDGDDANVSFAKRAIAMARHAMAVILDVGGEINLDSDFFPVANWDSSEMKDYLFDDVLSGDQVSRHHKERIYDALVELGISKDDKNLTVLINEIYDSVDKSGMTEEAYYDQVAKIFDKIYAGSKNVVLWNARDISEESSQGSESVLNAAEEIASNKYERALVQVTREITEEILVEGKTPMNFQDFRQKFCAYAGEVEGKNIAFRYIANIGKMFRYDERLQIGDNIDFKKLYTATCQFAMSARMSNAASADRREMTAKQHVRDTIIKSVGLPSKKQKDGSYVATYPNFYEFFVNGFVRKYQQEALFIQACNVQATTDMQYSRKSGKHDVKQISPGFYYENKDGKTIKKKRDYLAIGDAVAAFMDVYGDYSIEEIFAPYINFTRDEARLKDNKQERKMWGNNALDRYLGKSLHYFKVNNDLFSRLKEGEQYSGHPLKSDSSMYAQLVFAAIADSRTSAAMEFNRQYYTNEDSVAASVSDLCKSLRSELVEKIDDKSKNGKLSDNAQNWMFADDIFNVMFEMGPDLFLYHGMEDINSFLVSKYGKVLFRNNITQSEVASIRLAMLAEYRFGRIQDAIDALKEARKANADRRGRLETVMRAERDLKMEWDALRNSSIFWRGIVDDFRNGSPAFKELQKEQAYQRNAPGYWADPMHDNALQVLVDTTSLTFDEKCRIISDVVRFTTYRWDLSSLETGYQLEQDSSLPVFSDAPRSSVGVMKVSRDFRSRYNSFKNKQRENMYANIDSAYETYCIKKHKGKPNPQYDPQILERFLTTVADNPFLLVQVSNDIYADALCSSLDVTYHMTEKSRQHEWTNALYSALCFQRNGGMQNDIYRTDDRVLGVMHYSNITPIDVVRILADPDYRLVVYDDDGMPDIIDQKHLMDLNHNPRTKEKWAWLKANPRIATALRVHQVSVVSSDERTGETYLSAISNSTDSFASVANMKKSDLQVEKAKYILRDHPTFGGMVALFTPTHGNVTRRQRFRYKETEETLVRSILYFASMKQEHGDDLAVSMFRDELSDAIFAAAKKDLPAEFEESFPDEAQDVLDKIKRIDDKEANDLVNTVNRYLERYIDEISDQIPGIIAYDTDADQLIRGIDKSSMHAFWSVRQDLNGAKTNQSTGVEGSETFQFGPWVSLLNTRDRYADLELMVGDKDRSELAFLDGMDAILPDGSHEVITGDVVDMQDSNIDDILSKAMGMKKQYGTSDVVIIVPDDYLSKNEIPDRTTDSYGNQVSSVAAYMIIKRDNGAEKYNLKIKKFGDDGTDSITKFTKYLDGVDYYDILDDLQNVYRQTNDVDDVKFELAKRLYEANNNLDGHKKIAYDELDMANYMSLADIMVIEESGTIFLRSLEMMATAVKNNMPYGLVEDGSIEELKDAAQEIVTNISSKALLADNARSLVLRGLRVAGITNPNSSTVGYKARSSSFSRNEEVMREIRNDNPEVKLYGDQALKVIGDQIRDLYRKVNDEKLPSIYDNYNVLGYISTPDATIVNESIGPLALWIISASASEEQISSYLSRAEQLGITVAFEGMVYNKIPFKYQQEVILSNGRVFIPFFDMKLNGSEVEPCDGNFAVIRSDPSSVVASTEDPLNEYLLGDSDVQVFNSLTDRTNPFWAENVYISYEDLFPNVYRAYPDAWVEVKVAEKETIDKYIVGNQECTIDYGITEGAKGFEERVQRVNALIDKYRNAYQKLDNNAIRSWKTDDEIDAGDIVMFVDITVHTRENDVNILAPVIPFDLKGTSSVPTKYRVTGYSLCKNGVEVGWEYSGGIENQLFKIFEGGAAANKSVFTTDNVLDSPMLPCGIPIDYVMATPSTASRRAGTDRRIKTMDTLMWTARRKGYNFGEVESAFPYNRELAEWLQHGEIPMFASEKPEDAEGILSWEEILDNPEFVYHEDPELNAFVKMEVQKFYDNGSNPSYYLASHFDGEPNYVWWEYSAMYSNSLFYENAWLKFHHMMDNSLCPPNLYDSDGVVHDFRVNHGKDFDFGCLQMQVPHKVVKDGKEETFYMWQSVFMGHSFLGEEFSGFHKPSINGASMFLDAMNSMNMQGNILSSFDVRQLMKWGWADTPQRSGMDISVDLDLTVE